MIGDLSLYILPLSSNQLIFTTFLFLGPMQIFLYNFFLLLSLGRKCNLVTVCVLSMDGSPEFNTKQHLSCFLCLSYPTTAFFPECSFFQQILCSSFVLGLSFGMGIRTETNRQKLLLTWSIAQRSYFMGQICLCAVLHKNLLKYSSLT